MAALANAMANLDLDSDPILPSERQRIDEFRAMPVAAAIADIKAIKPSQYHLGDIFTRNGTIFVITGGKRDAGSNVYYYRIEDQFGNVRVRRDHNILGLYGSPLENITLDSANMIISDVCRYKPVLKAEMVTQWWIRRKESGELRTRREMVTASIRAAQNTTVAAARNAAAQESAAGNPPGVRVTHGDAYIRFFDGLNDYDSYEAIVGKPGQARRSKYLLGDVFFKGGVMYMITAGVLADRQGFLYRINGTDGSDRVFKEGKIQRSLGKQKKVTKDRFMSTLTAIARLFPERIVESGATDALLMTRRLNYNDNGTRRTEAERELLRNQWLRTQSGGGGESKQAAPAPDPDAMENPPKGDICAICLEPLSSGEVIQLKCSHMFHKSCIMPHQKTKNPRTGKLETRARTCPLCRKATPTLYSDGVWRLQKLRF